MEKNFAIEKLQKVPLKELQKIREVASRKWDKQGRIAYQLVSLVIDLKIGFGECFSSDLETVKQELGL